MIEVKIVVALGIVTEGECGGTSDRLKMSYFFTWMVVPRTNTYSDFYQAMPLKDEQFFML